MSATNNRVDTEVDALNAVVFASDFDSTKPSSLLLDQAHGWLRSAEWIAFNAAQAEPNGGVCHALPALFALYHGIELLLKGVTCELSGKYDNSMHDLESLLADYDSAVNGSGRLELRVKADVERLIIWDRGCRPIGPNKRRPHGSDLRFILDRENKPSWPGVSIRYRDIVDWSREYRRELARIRRLLFDVRGYSVSWEEGTFASQYPDQPLWFFCVCGKILSHGPKLRCQHELADAKGRFWVAYEGEAINEVNLAILAIGNLPEPQIRIECSLHELPARLALVD